MNARASDCGGPLTSMRRRLIARDYAGAVITRLCQAPRRRQRRRQTRERARRRPREASSGDGGKRGVDGGVAFPSPPSTFPSLRRKGERRALDARARARARADLVAAYLYVRARVRAHAAGESA